MSWPLTFCLSEMATSRNTWSPVRWPHVSLKFLKWSMSVKQNVKGQDIAARYGGEEFAVVLPNTVLRAAITVADHIRRAVMAKELKKKSTGEILGRVTISVGVSMLKPDDDTDSLIKRADACLYAAKRNGRNRVICEVDPEYAAENHSRVA